MNIVHEPRPPKNQRNYSDDELRVIFKAHNTGITATELAAKMGRSVESVSKKAGQQGVSLKRNK